MLLSFPGKIAAGEKSGTIVFSDSNHNRIVIAGLDGEIKDVIGDGSVGLQDGPFESARFFRPQGVFLDEPAGAIYVADTENHAIRKIDLSLRVVTTLSGDGQQASGPGREGKGVRLNSPWDLVRVGGLLYIAMAGPHQLWTLDLATSEARVHAGSGREDIIDGPLKSCALAQPSGITTDGARLYFADSEVSAIRSADLDPGGRVETLIGQGLFECGDIDGPRQIARLQHCIGVHYHDSALYVADTYNHKLRRYDLKTKELTTLAGSGVRGWKDGDARIAQLNEPNGLCFVDGRWFITDTNNNLIRVFDPKSNQLSTLTLKHLERLSRSRGADINPNIIRLEPQIVSAHASQLLIEIELPPGTHLNAGAPSHLRASSTNSKVAAIENATLDVQAPLVAIPIRLTPGETVVQAALSLYYCREGEEALCFFREERLEIPVRVTPDGPEVLTIACRIDGA